MFFLSLVVEDLCKHDGCFYPTFWMLSWVRWQYLCCLSTGTDVCCSLSAGALRNQSFCFSLKCSLLRTRLCEKGTSALGLFLDIISPPVFSLCLPARWTQTLSVETKREKLVGQRRLSPVIVGCQKQTTKWPGCEAPVLLAEQHWTQFCMFDPCLQPSATTDEPPARLERDRSI